MKLFGMSRYQLNLLLDKVPKEAAVFLGSSSTVWQPCLSTFSSHPCPLFLPALVLKLKELLIICPVKDLNN